jgi:hypothetical protein
MRFFSFHFSTSSNFLKTNSFEEGLSLLIPFYSLFTLEGRVAILVILVLFAWFSKKVV